MRMFRGIEGNKEKKGELFGLENLLKFRSDGFVSEMWKSHGRDMDINRAVNSRELVARLEAEEEDGEDTPPDRGPATREGPAGRRRRRRFRRRLDTPRRFLQPVAGVRDPPGRLRGRGRRDGRPDPGLPRCGGPAGGGRGDGGQRPERRPPL